MKSSNYLLVTRNALHALLFYAFLFFTGSCALSQEKIEEDETLSPYFFVQSDSPETDLCL